MSDAVPIRPAATVAVLRKPLESRRGELEVLLLRRAQGLSFHGGAWVFPGGRVDATDGAGADLLTPYRAAAVREAREEAGLVLSPHSLTPFSHWTTPEGRTRRFATWFFLAEVAHDAEVVIDGGEIHAHRWCTPQEALALQAQGELELPPPTFVSLSVLARAACIADALCAARGDAPPVFVPRPRAHPQGAVSLYEGDAAYAGAALDAPGPRHRLWMLAGGYRYERAL